MSSLGVSSSLLQIDEPKHQTKHFRQLLVDASSRLISSLLASAAAWSRFWTLSLRLSNAMRHIAGCIARRIREPDCHCMIPWSINLAASSNICFSSARPSLPSGSH
ncbi:hypothetical protein BD408DRAFT_417507 [Parasitella parasitica]|nr:hypothetical protein BD408DRAFT_417507 [Parasitella parasitica]